MNACTILFWYKTFRFRHLFLTFQWVTVVPITYNVSESRSAGYEIGTVRASDSDSGINAEIIYSIQNNNFGIFSINSETGKVTLAKKLGK